jgi:hypothetical protein
VEARNAARLLVVRQGREARAAVERHGCLVSSPSRVCLCPTLSQRARRLAVCAGCLCSLAPKGALHLAAAATLCAGHRPSVVQLGTARFGGRAGEQGFGGEEGGGGGRRGASGVEEKKKSKGRPLIVAWRAKGGRMRSASAAGTTIVRRSGQSRRVRSWD